MINQKTKLELKLENNSLSKKHAMFILVLLHKSLLKEKQKRKNSPLAYRKIFYIIKKVEKYLGITPQLKRTTV